MAIATELAVQLRKAAPLQARARQILSVPASKSARQAWYTCIALITAIASTPAAFAFGFDDVAAIALRTAAKPYVPPAALRADLPKFDYDAFRDIRFRTENAPWHRQGRPFELQFFLAVRDQTAAIS